MGCCFTTPKAVLNPNVGSPQGSGIAPAGHSNYHVDYVPPSTSAAVVFPSDHSLVQRHNDNNGLPMSPASNDLIASNYNAI